MGPPVTSTGRTEECGSGILGSFPITWPKARHCRNWRKISVITTGTSMRRNGLSLLFLFCAPAVMQAAALSANPYAKLPLAFERQGEGPQERYVARGNGYMIALEGGSAAIGVQAQDGTGSTVSMGFAGSRQVSGTAGPELPGKVNYLRGNDPKQWRFGLSTYGSVSYREIYPAIDVVYRGNQRQMEFDLVLRPGSEIGNDPKQWRFGLSTYGSVSYREIYPAIDVVYRGNQRQMEFDLVLRPGA